MALEPLARQLGYRPDPRNRARWKRNGSVLAIDGSRFFDHRQGRGGGQWHSFRNFVKSL